MVLTLSKALIANESIRALIVDGEGDVSCCSSQAIHYNPAPVHRAPVAQLVVRCTLNCLIAH